MSKFIIVFSLIFLQGCEIKKSPSEMKGAGDLRYKIFKDCMDLASKIQNSSTVESELNDVVYECSNQAWYISNQIMKTKGGE